MESLTAKELAEWEAYSIIEPFGPLADFWRAGLIAAMLYNVNRKEGARPATPKDFLPGEMPWENEEPEELSKAEADAIAEQVKAAFMSLGAVRK